MNYKRDAIGRLTEMNVFGSLAATGGVPDHALPIATEEFLTDSLGRTHKEEYSFTYAPANTLEVTSSWTAGNPYRSGLSYADNLGSGSTAPLSMDFGHDTIGRLTSIDWTGHSGSTTALADYEWVGGLRRNRFVRYSASSYPEGKTSFAYDAYNRLTQIQDDVYTAGSTFTTKSQFDYEYDVASNLLKEKYAKVDGGVGDRFAYDGHHRLTAAWMGVDATLMAAASNPSGWVSGQMHSYLTYGLDDANNRTSTGVQDAGGTATTDYDLQGGSHPQGPSNRYDAVGPSGGALTPYEYDGRGNLIRDGVFVFRYDYLNRLQEVWKIRVDGGDDTEQYALVQEGADEEARQEVKLEVPDLMQRLPREHTNPTFRARLRAEITGGVIRLRGTGQGGGQSGGGMPSFTTPAQADLHAVYAYDAYNRRIMGIVVGVDTQFHTWDGWRQVVQYSLDTAPSPDAAVPTKQFVWGSRLDELLSYRRKNGSAWENYFVLHGGQDTAAKLVNSSGAVVEQYEYDPYGRVSVYVGSSTTAVATSSVGLPFLWKGVRLDSETGLLQMRNRYYSTSLGRFLTRDPLGVWGDKGNMGCAYAYAGASPLGVSDPLGLQGERPFALHSYDPGQVPNSPGPAVGSHIDKAIAHAERVVSYMRNQRACVYEGLVERLIRIRSRDWIRITDLRIEFPAVAMPDFSSKSYFERPEAEDGDYIDVFTSSESGIEISKNALGGLGVPELASLLMHESVHTLQSFALSGPGGWQRAAAEIQATALQIGFMDAQLVSGELSSSDIEVIEVYKMRAHAYIYGFAAHIVCDVQL